LARRLAVITADLKRNSTKLTIVPPSTSCRIGALPPCLKIDAVFAGRKLTTVEISVAPDMFGTSGSKFRIVRKGVTKAMAQAGACKEGDLVNGAHTAVVQETWATSGIATKKIGAVGAEAIQRATGLMFLMGGEWRICYSDDGSFKNNHVDLVGPYLDVKGFYDSSSYCMGTAEKEHYDSCLTTRRHHCYVMKEAYNNYKNEYAAGSNCLVDFHKAGAGFRGAIGKGVWSQEFLTTYTADFAVKKITPQKCGTVPAFFICAGVGGCKKTPIFFNLDASRNNESLPLPPTRNDLTTSFRAYMVAACYCPGFDKCDAASDFVQQVGILYYYATKICPRGYDGISCTPYFAGVTPQHRFAVRVECPGDACEANGISRIKIISQHANNDLPAWDTNNGCFAGVHGRSIRMNMVLPDGMSLNVSDVYGGTRQDWKLWNFPNGTTVHETAGFLFYMGHADHELRNFEKGESFDVCYCDNFCDSNPRNWFKTGQLRFASFGLVSAVSNVSKTATTFSVQYVNQPGVLGFYRPPIDYNVMGLNELGMLKLVEDNAMAMTDARCAAASYDRFLVNADSGPYTGTAHTTFAGKTNKTVDPNKLLFNNGNSTKYITVMKAGALAVCYCARVEKLSGLCYRNEWVMSVRLTIRGPAPGQSWMFSTHVVFRFNYTGWGLSNDDKIRIIAATASCQDGNQNPSGAYITTNIKMQCPDPCSEIGGPSDVVNGDLRQVVVGDSTYKCDIQNKHCRNNDIKSVQQVGNKATKLVFEADPGMKNGDLISLGENIICDPTDITCTPEQLAVVKGRYPFADKDANNMYAPDEYLAGHAISLTALPKEITIPVGWPGTPPRFLAQYKNNKRGRWNQHNRAITKEEVMGTKERRDMKVCWKYSGPLGTFVTEVGRLTLMDPNPMSNCLISLTSTVKNERAPLVVSFKTASAQTGKRYSNVQGSTRLKIIFMRTLAIEMRFVDDSKIENNAGEDELQEAKQYICGKLFKELWSSDKELGFPMPRGCYHQSYGIQREFTMLFERKNGLRAGMDYQMVVNGIASDEAKANGEYISIFTMDDTESKPYEAIERGSARLGKTPQDGSYGGEGVKWLVPDGFKIARGSGANLYEIGSGAPIFAEMRGDVAGGGIRKNAFLRLFLWPVTQWDVLTQCEAGCIAFDQVTAPCGAMQSCMTEPVVPNFAKNILIMRLPADMATCTTEVYQTIFVSNLRLPKGGFFATKMGAQISRPDDTKPHYTTSVGDFLFKQPDKGETIGRLVEVFGDGDQKPFRGDKGNVLYAHVVLAATLFSAVQNGDAQLMLTLPDGYQCQRPNDIDGRSPWEAEENLGAFGTTIPQGRGTADDGSGTRGWSVNGNNCTYTLRQNGVVYAGSSLYFRVTVNNPMFPLMRKSTANRWMTTLKSKGVHQWSVTFPSETFKTTGSMFGDNAAVLGRIEEASLVPMNFGKSANSFIVAEGQLHIFFLTQLSNGVNGFVRLVSPEGFVFTPTPCHASDLPMYQYQRHHTKMDTRRLPGITNCSYVPAPMNSAEVGLVGALQPNTYYGFRINVRNAMAFMQSALDGWKIFTLTKEKYGVDGTPKPVPLIAVGEGAAKPTTSLGINVENKSYGLHQYSLNTANVELVKISIASLRPFTETNKPTIVTVRPLKVPVSKTTTLRIVAPAGFAWKFSSTQFIHKFSTGTDGMPCVTATLPGGVPAMDGNVLAWSTPAMYSMSQTYGFMAPIHVPLQTSTSSVNAFIVEFGYNSMMMDQRIGAAMVEIKEDRAVSYIEKSGPKGWIFQMPVTAAVAPGGGIQLVGPSGFYLNADCTASIKAAPTSAGCVGAVFPTSTQCTYAVAGAATIITLKSPGPWPAGLYRFQIDFATAYDPYKQNTVVVGSECGFQTCWKYQAVGISAGVFDWRSSKELGGNVVAALADADVDYVTNVESKANNLLFQLQIITRIHKGGVINVTGPAGFQIASSCELMKATGERGSPYEEIANKGRQKSLPMDATCHSDNHVGYNVSIMITSGSTIEPGFYRWAIAAGNPKIPTPNPMDTMRPCGYRHCWLFKTIEKPLINQMGVELDVPMWAKSFAINRRMVEGLIPPLTASQRTKTLRDDRPLKGNPIVFAFKLNRAVIEPFELYIRGPLGYVFAEECMSSIEWRGFVVFGETLNTLQYTAWDAGVKILSCRGEGPDARMWLDPGSSAGLQAESLYPIRIKLQANPFATPALNDWQIDYAGESCNPFTGFPLWTFSRLSMYTVSTAKSNPVTGSTKLDNPVTITFRPHNTVLGTDKKIKITAPPNFEIARDKHNNCKLIMQPLLSDPNADQFGVPSTNFSAPLSFQWLQADCSCVVDPMDTRKMLISILADKRELYSHTDYQLTFFVNNPTLIPDVPDYRWSLETEANPSDHKPLFRDLSVLNGFAINDRMNIFIVRNEDPATKVSFRNGKSIVPGLYLEVQFPFKVNENDVIDIVAPAGFMLARVPRPTGAALAVQGATCDNWKWEPITDKYLPTSPFTCVKGRMQIRYKEMKPWPERKPIKWRMNTYNVAKTPHKMLNHWTVTIRNKFGVIRASDAVLSWDIRPQLEDVRIMVTGAQMSAGSMSRMTISFFPIQDADELRLVAKVPTGFDFTGAGSDILGHEVISTSVEVIRVRATMYADKKATIMLNKFKLGLIGGATLFDLVTKLNSGEPMDERFGFLGGFRLPGRLTVSDKKLNSKYQQDSMTHPVLSLWGNRISEEAMATFIFSLTLQADIGMTLRLEASPYVFSSGFFQLEEVSSKNRVVIENKPPIGKHVEVILRGPLWKNTLFRVQCSVTTPMVLNPTDAMWSIEILDGPIVQQRQTTQGAKLPVNTNDKLTPGFHLVKQMPFKILAAKSPPMSRVPVEVQINPLGTMPTECLVVAPPLFNFTENCLADAGTDKVAMSCERTSPVAGQEAALIKFSGAGLRTVSEFVKINVITPASNAPNPSWYAQMRDGKMNKELGWGADPTGLKIRQMSGAGVVFPGIPSISGQMAFRFETNLKVEANGKLRIGYPKSIEVDCMGASLHSVGLKGNIRCTNFPREGYLEINLPRPLPPGRQAVAVTSTCPNAINDVGGNVFYIMVIDPESLGGNVVDAAMKVDGMRIQHGISVRYLPLTWGSSEPSRHASVSLGFELLADLPERDPPTISSLLIRMPRDFYHVVKRLSQVEIQAVPHALPTKDGLWLDFRASPNYLRVHLDEAQSRKLKPGRYRIQFPVFVPGRMPRNNVWLLTLCGPQRMAAGECMDENHPRALVTFPLSGFKMNEVHPATAQDGQISTSHWRRASCLTVLLSVLTFWT